MPTLTWERRDGQRMVFHLQGHETAIGREIGNQVHIESGYVSKRHAVIRMGQQGCTIADLNSSNGTLVNGQPVTLAALRDGDRIELGSEVLVFSEQAAGLPQPAARSSTRSPLLLAVVGGAVVVLVAMVLLVTFSGSPEPTGARAPAADAGTVRATDPGAAPPTAMPPELTSPVPDAGAVPGGEPAADEALPSQDPVALYEMALSHVKGKRLVEARRLLDASVRLDPSNPSAQQRLREVDATIQAMIDQNLAAGQRDFMYLRYADAILLWEQVLSMTVPSDPRYQQAAAGIQRARVRLGR